MAAIAGAAADAEQKEPPTPFAQRRELVRQAIYRIGIDPLQNASDSLEKPLNVIWHDECTREACGQIATAHTATDPKWQSGAAINAPTARLTALPRLSNRSTAMPLRPPPRNYRISVTLGLRKQ